MLYFYDLSEVLITGSFGMYTDVHICNRTLNVKFKVCENDSLSPLGHRVKNERFTPLIINAVCDEILLFSFNERPLHHNCHHDYSAVNE